MKKIFMTFSTVATFTIAVVLTSCNNAEEVKKQVEEQTAKIQTAVDEKLTGLQEEVNTECIALVDSLANAQYADFLATTAKPGAKPKPKPKAPTAKKEEPKPETIGSGKPKMGEVGATGGTIGSGKPKMGATGSTGSTTIGNGKPKMGGGN